MKKFNDVVREYARWLSDEDLKYVGIRLANRLGGDMGEAIEVLQRHAGLDRWLAAANSADEFFAMIDQLDYYVQSELKKRFGGHEQKERQKSR